MGFSHWLAYGIASQRNYLHTDFGELGYLRNGTKRQLPAILLLSSFHMWTVQVQPGATHASDSFNGTRAIPLM
jgi:hypothetical protein